ncbi:MAG: rod shape-determining protein MreD [Firmicutes bacterium]|nr:rod shape-determining protein MreD [Bacillota bacterium]
MEFVVLFIVNILVFILQSSVVSHFEIMGITANLMLMFVISTAIIKGPGKGLFCGIVMGLLQDFYFCEYVGCNFFIYALIAYIAGTSCKNLVKDNIFLPLICSVASTLIYNVLFYVINVFLKGYIHGEVFLLKIVLPETVCNAIAILFVYFTLLPVYEFLDSRSKKYVNKVV